MTRNIKAAGCKICGLKTVGRGIGEHVEGAHHITPDDYKTCFHSGKVIVDALEETGTAGTGRKRVSYACADTSIHGPRAGRRRTQKGE